MNVFCFAAEATRCSFENEPPSFHAKLPAIVWLALKICISDHLLAGISPRKELVCFLVMS